MEVPGLRRGTAGKLIRLCPHSLDRSGGIVAKVGPCAAKLTRADAAALTKALVEILAN